MDKIGVFSFVFLIFTVLTVQAENTNKPVVKIVGSGLSWDLIYSEDGFITGILDDSEKRGELLWSYDYNPMIDGSPYIIQCGYYRPGNEFNYVDGEPTFIRESKLNASHLVSNDKNRNMFIWSTGEDFNYEYDNGRMVKMTGSDGIVAYLSWTEDDLTEIVFLENEEEAGRIKCSYTDIPADGVCQAFTSPLMLLLDYYTIQSLGPLAHGYYGLLSLHLLKEMDISFNDNYIEKHSCVDMLSASYYPITKKKNRKFSYENDTNGNVSRVIVSEDTINLTYLIEYENYSNDIKSSIFIKNNTSCYYNLNGITVSNAPRSGIYIREDRKRVVSR